MKTPLAAIVAALMMFTLIVTPAEAGKYYDSGNNMCVWTGHPESLRTDTTELPSLTFPTFGDDEEISGYARIRDFNHETRTFDTIVATVFFTKAQIVVASVKIGFASALKGTITVGHPGPCPDGDGEWWVYVRSIF